MAGVAILNPIPTALNKEKMAKIVQASKLNSTRTHCTRVCSRFPALRGIVGGRSGGNLARNYHATSSMSRAVKGREKLQPEFAKNTPRPSLTSPKKKPRCAKNRGNGDDARWHPPRQINVSNSNTFHIPTSNCLLLCSVCLWWARINLEKDCKCQSVSCKTPWAICLTGWQILQ